eukprot:283383-Chlamydomonas_euryale.AAC.2
MVEQVRGTGLVVSVFCGAAATGCRVDRLNVFAHEQARGMGLVAERFCERAGTGCRVGRWNVFVKKSWGILGGLCDTGGA